MRCPRCGGIMNPVYCTRGRGKKKEKVVRYRECQNKDCKIRFTTEESVQHAEDYEEVKK